MDRKLLVVLPLCFVLADCSTPYPRQQHDGPPTYYRDVSYIQEPTPHYLPKSHYGNPDSYTVAHATYHVLPSASGYNKRGIASWYGSKFSGRLTSTRERYDPYAFTAASPILPIPCYARVTNLENGRSIVVKINDRGPFAPNRIIDLSYAAAIKLGYERKGTALVNVATLSTEDPNAPPVIQKPNNPQLYLQVGVFSHYQYANHIKNKIELAVNKKTLIKTSDHHHHTVYRVQVGPLGGASEADHVQALLKRDGFGNAISIVR